MSCGRVSTTIYRPPIGGVEATVEFDESGTRKT
jgi:hypothetical protein